MLETIVKAIASRGIIRENTADTYINSLSERVTEASGRGDWHGWTSALVALAAAQGSTVADLQAKATALQTCRLAARGQPVAIEGDCGLAWSMALDVMRMWDAPGAGEVA